MNRAQAGRLETTLRLLNESLFELERVLALPDVDEPTFRWTCALSDERKSRASARAVELRAAIGRLAREHSVAKREENALARVTAQLHAHWVSIEDTKCKALSKYGELPAGLKDTLDPQLDRLNDGVRALLDELTVRRS
jgi:hypothetical protein